MTRFPNLGEVVPRDIAPDKYLAMIECQDADPQHVDTNWESCGSRVGIDTGAVRVAGDFVWVTAHDIQTVWVLRR